MNKSNGIQARADRKKLQSGALMGLPIANYFFVLTILGALCTARTAMAELVNYNNPAIEGKTNDGSNLTYDSRTKIAWLDTSITDGYSTNQIKARLADPDDQLYGFRYATQNEIDSLLQSYGMPGNGSVAGTLPAASFIQNFGGGGPGERTSVGPAMSAVWPVSDDLAQAKQIISREGTNESSVSQGGYALDTKASGHFLVVSRVFVKHNTPHLSLEAKDKNNLTLDTRTGLSWLDATIAETQSVNQIQSRLADSNDDLHGLRYATQEEIDFLLKGYGLPGNGETQGTKAALAFIGDFGAIQPGNRTMLGPSISLMWPVSEDLSQAKQIIAHTTSNTLSPFGHVIDGGVEPKSSVSQGGRDPDSTDGHFLVFAPEQLVSP